MKCFTKSVAISFAAGLIGGALMPNRYSPAKIPNRSTPATINRDRGGYLRQVDRAIKLAELNEICEPDEVRFLAGTSRANVFHKIASVDVEQMKKLEQRGSVLSLSSYCLNKEHIL